MRTNIWLRLLNNFFLHTVICKLYEIGDHDLQSTDVESIIHRKSEISCVLQCEIDENCMMIAFQKYKDEPFGNCLLLVAENEKKYSIVEEKLPDVSLYLKKLSMCKQNPCGKDEFCEDTFGGDSYKCIPAFKDCTEIFAKGIRKNGEYAILVKGENHQVVCDLTQGGYTVLQRRISNVESFHRTWIEFKTGFGSFNENFWLGNDLIHKLTDGNAYELKVELKYQGNNYYAIYQNFHVASESEKYKLTLGSYSGTAGDSLRYHSGSIFSSIDQDNDSHSTRHCASLKGGYWHKACQQANINGFYDGSGESGICWKLLNSNSGGITETEMKIRRVG